jgi:hypothetical protein
MDTAQFQTLIDTINTGYTIMCGSILALIFAVTWKG